MTYPTAPDPNQPQYSPSYPQTGEHPQQGGYPPPGYPPQQGGYPPPAYPPQPGGYPPQQGGYPAPAYAPQQQGGYPPPGYPPQMQGGYPPPGYPQAAYAPAPKVQNRLANVALLYGSISLGINIVALFFLGYYIVGVLAVYAIVQAIRGIMFASRQPGNPGIAQAIIGLILGILSIGVTVLAVVLSNTGG